MKFSEYGSIDLSGKTVLITGANAGLGFEAALFFASKNALVIGAVRSLSRGLAAQDTIIEKYPNAMIVMCECDLSNSHSIKSFASSVKSTYPMIDILLNNAGIMAIPYALTVDGHEMQMGVNHLGHFKLTALLFDHLNANARIVNVSSMAHMQGTVDLSDLSFKHRKYQSFKSYAQSKLSNLLFTHELNKRLVNDTRRLLAVSAHPGVAMTSLFDKVETSLVIKSFKPIFKLFAASAQKGSEPLIMACLDPHACIDDFYGPPPLFKDDIIKRNKMSNLAHDQKLQSGLWTLSNKLTGLNFLE